MKKVQVINGPNLNLLGQREKFYYGEETLADLNNKLSGLAAELNLQIDFFQSNSESTLIDKIHACLDEVNFIIINPAAFTHTSIALRDAMLAVNIPFIEVHISNIYSREPFRQHSYFSDIAKATLSGLGLEGYFFALRSAHSFLQGI